MEMAPAHLSGGLPQNPAFQFSDSISAWLARLPLSRNDLNHPKQPHDRIESIVALGESLFNHGE
jgi:hypothetical protein